VISKIIDVYVAEREGSESFIDVYRRLGIAPFKLAAYGFSSSNATERDEEELKV
jgi:sulfite reductase (NADPH) hemoprotein beta-component